MLKRKAFSREVVWIIGLVMMLGVSGMAEASEPAYPFKEVTRLLNPEALFQAIAVSSTAQRVIPLTPGVPASISCAGSPQAGYWVACETQFSIDVPGDTTRLRVNLETEGKTVLLLQFGSPIEFTREGLERVDGAWIAEKAGRWYVELDARSDPPLKKPGTYYIGLGNWETFTQRYTVTAILTREAPTPPRPTADFTADPTSGVAPLTVQFTDRSSGEITSYSWDFGDGGTSTSRNPSYTYRNPGTFTVRLTVRGPGGEDTKTRSNYITVSPGITPPPTGGLLVLKFIKLEFVDPAAWERTLKEGCVIYKNISGAPSKIKVTLPDNSVLEFDIPPGKEVIVCGDVVHIDRRG